MLSAGHSGGEAPTASCTESAIQAGSPSLIEFPLLGSLRKTTAPEDCARRGFRPVTFCATPCAVYACARADSTFSARVGLPLGFPSVHGNSDPRNRCIRAKRIPASVCSHTAPELGRVSHEGIGTWTFGLANSAPGRASRANPRSLTPRS
jgi:hypothetical protein